MRLAPILGLVFVLAACAPTFTPATEPLPDVVLTATTTDVGTLYRVEGERPFTLYLRFVGTDLDTGASECTVTPTAVSCAVGQVTAWFEMTVIGTVDPLLRTYGYACRDTCHPLYLSEAP